MFLDTQTLKITLSITTLSFPECFQASRFKSLGIVLGVAILLLCLIPKFLSLYLTGVT